MTAYAIRCETPGESVLAQKILFKKGRAWVMSGRHIQPRRTGAVLCIRKRGLTSLPLSCSDDNLRERGFQVINMSELNSL